MQNVRSPLYRFLIDHFPIQFMQKLLSIIISGSSQVIQNYAAMLLTYHFGDIMEQSYSGIDIETLQIFQTNALLFLNSGPQVQKCGQVMASKLLSLSLHYNQEWREFLEFTAQAFTLHTDTLDSILDIFVMTRFPILPTISNKIQSIIVLLMQV